MRQRWWMIATDVVGASLAAPAWANDYVDSKPLLCSPADAMECAHGIACARVPIELIDIPRFFEIDFEAKRISAIAPGEARGTTTILNQQKFEGETILQGA